MITNLQVLRAAAAMNVVLFHVLESAKDYGHPSTYLAFLEGWGRNGVDLFFVLSGFVMLHTYMHRKKSARQFITSRIVRIVPLYWFVTLASVLSIFVLPSGAFNSFSLDLNHTATSLLFASQAILNKAPIVYVGWTLEWEMLFYLIFATAILIAHRVPLLASSLVLISAAALLTGKLFIFEFFIGMVIAYLYRHVQLSKLTGSLILSVGVIALCFSIRDFNVFGLSNADPLIASGLPSSIIILGAIYCWQSRHRLFIYLGDASYSIYLCQTLSIPIFYKLVKAADLSTSADLLCIAGFAFSVIAGCLLYSLIELPTTRFLRNRVR